MYYSILYIIRDDVFEIISIILDDVFEIISIILDDVFEIISIIRDLNTKLFYISFGLVKQKLWQTIPTERENRPCSI